MYVKNYSGSGHPWLSGEVVKTTGPVSYLVRLSSGRTRCCHQDQLRSTEGDGEAAECVPHDSQEDDVILPAPTLTSPETESIPVPQPPECACPIPPTLSEVSTDSHNEPATSVSRYPRRD